MENNSYFNDNSNFLFNYWKTDAALKIGAFEVVAKILLQYVHERIWSKIVWYAKKIGLSNLRMVNDTKNIGDYVNSLNDTYKNASLTEILTFLDTSLQGNVILASSLGLEDQLLTHEWLGINSSARIFVLDTGRLNEETYNVMEETMQTYSFKYEILHPNEDEIQNLLSSKGSFSL